MALGATSTSLGRIFSMMPTVAPASSRRDWPGFCLAPAVMAMTSASRQISGSSEPETEPAEVNWIPWAMSRASASTFSLTMSCRTTSRATPLVTQA